MKSTLNFYIEAKFIKGRDGKIYNPSGVMKYSVFQRYLSVFSEVKVIARVLSDPNFQGNKIDLVEGQNVSVIPLTFYHGPLEYLIKSKKVLAEIKETINLEDAYILRVPGHIGSIAYNYLRRKKKDYGVEVVGDPYDVFSKGAVKHPLRLFFKFRNTFQLKRIVKNAKCALYVTREMLQNRYPNEIKFTASNVELKTQDFYSREKNSFFKNNTLSIVSIGTLDQMYKGPDILLKAIKKLIKQQLDIRLIWIGEGRYKKDMIELSERLCISDNVKFIGYLSSREKINDILDSSDLFILASRTEGLSRAIIEAQSRSLPVIASNIGGIPELVEKKHLFQNKNHEDLSAKIQMFYNNPELLFKVGVNNYNKSFAFTYDVLDKERRAFYNYLIS